MTDGILAIDTSVAIAHLLTSHTEHAAVREWLRGRSLALTAHSLAETYAVLTRLPGDARVAPADAVAIIDANYPRVIAMDPATSTRVHERLAGLGIAGGAVYDALVAVAARDAGCSLATRDARAGSTYRAVGVTVEIMAQS